MSELQRSGLSLPMEATMAAALGWSGHLETSAFQGLSAGNTCSAATMASASGVLNITGAVIAGSFWPALTGGPSSADWTAQHCAAVKKREIENNVRDESMKHLRLM